MSDRMLTNGEEIEPIRENPEIVVTAVILKIFQTLN